MAQKEPDSNLTRARWNRRVEALGLALLAALPIVPYVTFLLRSGVPRFELFGDFALLEQATRHVWNADSLLGPYSRFHWHHPGPLFFHVVAPFQKAFGTASTGLYIGTCFVNAASAAAIVACARLFARRAHALAALLVVLAWFAAFGNVSANPWNPLVVVLPTMAWLLTAGLFARGKSAAAYPAVVFGALVTQTHVAVVSTVLVTGAVAVVAFVVGSRRRRAAPTDPWIAQQDRDHLAMAAGLLLLLFVPPIVEQLTATEEGNFRRIANFFLHRRAPLKPFEVALQQWTTATSWLPDRVLGRSLVSEGYIPLGMRWDAVPTGTTKTARTLTVVHVALTTIALIVARRRRDSVSIALLVFGTLANAIAVTALQAIVGVSYHYLVFWTTAGSSIAWVGVLSTAFSAIGEAAVRVPRISSVLAPALVLLGLTGAVSTTSLQRNWFAKYPVAPASRPPERDDLRAVYASLRDRLGAEGTPVIHAEGAWDMAYAIVLELEKDGVDVRAPERDRWIYAGVPSLEGAKKPLHVWFSTTPLPLPFATCLSLVTKSGDITMYSAPHDTTSCPPR